MGQKKTKPLLPGEYVSIIIEACKPAKMFQKPNGEFVYLSNWNRPYLFTILYDSMSNPADMALKTMTQIRDMGLIIYLIKVETKGMFPREEIVTDLKDLVENNKDVFPAMSDNNQPSCKISIMESDFVTLALKQLRDEGVKIYSKYGVQPDTMEYRMEDKESPVTMMSDMQSM